jgi:hypothetical protein
VTNLIRYDAMCLAIAECHRVDEVKDIGDKAMALEVYAKQAGNKDAERKACEIRLRAERRTGELLKDLKREQGGSGRFGSPNDVENRPSEYAQALESNKISTQAASRYQALAGVRNETFEAAFRDPDEKPSAAGILAKAGIRPPAAVSVKHDPHVLWLWGVLRQFERDRVLARGQRQFAVEMNQVMMADARRLLPGVISWLTTLKGEIDGYADAID